MAVSRFLSFRSLVAVLFGALSGLAPAQVRVTTLLALSDEPGSNVLNVTLSALGIEDEESSELVGAVEATLEIDPVSGQFDAGEHEVTLDEGVITGSSIVGEVNENFSQSPVSDTGAGTGTVELSRIAIKGNTVTYGVMVDLPVQFCNPLQEGVDVRVSSTVHFEGVIEVPLDPYLGWAEIQGIPDAAFEGDHDGDGVPNGLLWALGYDADARPRLFVNDPLIPGQVDLILEHGPAGIRAPITVEGNFSQEGWTAVDPFLILGFENPIPVGEILPTVVLLSGDRNFIRLRVEKP